MAPMKEFLHQRNIRLVLQSWQNLTLHVVRHGLSITSVEMLWPRASWGAVGGAFFAAGTKLSCSPVANYHRQKVTSTRGPTSCWESAECTCCTQSLKPATSHELLIEMSSLKKNYQDASHQCCWIFFWNDSKKYIQKRRQNVIDLATDILPSVSMLPRNVYNSA